MENVPKAHELDSEAYGFVVSFKSFKSSIPECIVTYLNKLKVVDVLMLRQQLQLTIMFRHRVILVTLPG